MKKLIQFELTEKTARVQGGQPLKLISLSQKNMREY